MAPEHSTFVIERRFEATPTRVFATWASADEKRAWFACHDDWARGRYALDFRVGGSEDNEVTPPGSVPHLYRAHYFDIVAGERIVYAYEMRIGSRRISVSLVTVMFAAADTGTRMTFTEQVAFLDGYADDGERRRGTDEQMQRLHAHLGA